MHVGKLWPIVARPRIVGQNSSFTQSPPRKMFLECFEVIGGGSVSGAWYLNEALSSVVEMESAASEYFHYRWDCPGDASQWIIGRIRFEPVTDPVFPFYKYNWYAEWKNYVDGVNWYTTNTVSQTHQIFGAGTHTLIFNLGLGEAPRPGEWVQARFWLRVARWDDQPEYHPYRH